MKNKLLLMVTVICLLGICLTGCSLAQEEKRAQKQEDRLIGVYVVDSKASELDDIVDPKEAQVIWGEDGYVERIQVEGLKGKYLADYVGKDSDGEDVAMIIGDDAFFETSNSMNIADNSKEYQLSSSISYLLASDEEQPVFQMHPIYERADGSVYVQPTANSAQGNRFGDMTLSISDKISTTKNDETREESSLVKVTFKGMNWPLSYTILEYDKEDHLLEKKTYLPDQVPEKIKGHKDMEYVILSMEIEDADGKIGKKRTLHEKEEGQIIFGVWEKTEDSLLNLRQTMLK